MVTVLSWGKSKLRSWTEARCMMMLHPKVSMGGRPHRVREVMERWSPAPVLPDWQPCVSLKYSLVALEAESREDGNGNR